MIITQKDVDSIVARAQELGAGEAMTYKNNLWDINTYGKPHDVETLAHMMIEGWHKKYDLIYAVQAALEFVEKNK